MPTITAPASPGVSVATQSPVASRPASPTPIGPVLGLQPQDLLNRCGWSTSDHAPTLWRDAKVYVQFPTSVRVGVTTTVSLVFDWSRAESASPVQIRLGLCATDRLRIAGQRSWDLTVSPGKIVSTTTAIVFSEVDEFELQSAGYNLGTGQITGGSQRVRVASAAAVEARAATAGWVTIAEQGFEGEFPAGSWQSKDLISNPCELCWDDVSYRARSGGWSVWPCAGGSFGYNPANNDQYQPYVETRITYRPVDLSNALYAQVDFFLWRQFPTYPDYMYDYLVFEVSTDGTNFTPIKYWWDTNETWEWEQFYEQLAPYVGNSHVTFGWRFVSDWVSVGGLGPYLDDIRIFKYLGPGQISVHGVFSYTDERNQIVPGTNVMAYLYDKSLLDDGDVYYLDGPVYTSSSDGSFSFQAVTNWNSTENRPLNPYVIFSAYVRNSTTSTNQVLDGNSNNYLFKTDPYYNAPDGSIDLSKTVAGPATTPEVKALWVLRDLRLAWEYVYANGDASFGAADPGSVTVFWAPDLTSWPGCTGSCQNGYAVFIRTTDADLQDVVIHEVGHEYMWLATAVTYPGGPHEVFVPQDSRNAWFEGWADFFPLAVSGSSCFNGDLSTTCPDGADPSFGYNFEWQSRGAGVPTGDQVEGRIAGALWDLLDSRSDGLDTVSFPFYMIWGTMNNSPAPQTMRSCWDTWRARGHESHYSVRAIYENTIDYDSAPVLAQLPNQTVFWNTVNNHRADLWSYASDAESTQSQVDYWIFEGANTNCGVSVSDNRYVNIIPTTGWTGQCSITIRANDGMKSSNGSSFVVDVIPRDTRLFLPFVSKQN